MLITELEDVAFIQKACACVAKRPTLTPDDIRSRDAVRAIIEGRGGDPIPASLRPDLNPTGQVFAKLNPPLEQGGTDL